MLNKSHARGVFLMENLQSISRKGLGLETKFNENRSGDWYERFSLTFRRDVGICLAPSCFFGR